MFRVTPWFDPRFAWVLVAAFFAASLTVHSAENGVPPSAASAGIIVAVEADKTGVLGEPLNVAISITYHGSPSSVVTVSGMEIQPMGVLRRYYKPLDTAVLESDSNFSDSKQFKEITVPAGQTVFFLQTLSPSDKAWLKSLMNTAQDSELLVTIRFANQREDRRRLGIRVQSPTISVLAGGLAGAGLLSLFGLMFAYLNAPQTPIATPPLAIRDQLAEFALSVGVGTFRFAAATLMGGILAMLIIALTRATTAVTLPIAVRVDDFVGGLLVGVFSHIFAPWLAKKLNVGEPGAAPLPSESR